MVHSYFFEAFKKLDQMEDADQTLPCLKYMMLCKILGSLSKALKISAGGNVKAKSEYDDVTGMISSQQSVKFAAKDKFKKELQDDLVIKHYLHILQEQLLESNFNR